MSVGERIRECRKSIGLTQRELAEKSGVATVSVQQYERGVRQPRTEQLKEIAAALGVSPLYLLGDETATMSRADVAASIGLEDYLKSLGYEFIMGYEYEGEEHDLCIDRKRKKLYLLPPRQLETLEQSLKTFTKFSLSELVSEGKEISDTEGWFSNRRERPAVPQTPPPPTEGTDTTQAPEGLREPSAGD